MFLFGGTSPLETLHLRGQMAEENEEEERRRGRCTVLVEEQASLLEVAVQRVALVDLQVRKARPHRQAARAYPR